MSDTRLQVVVSLEEKRRIKRAAEEAGQSVSNYVRWCINQAGQVELELQQWGGYRVDDQQKGSS